MKKKIKIIIKNLEEKSKELKIEEDKVDLKNEITTYCNNCKRLLLMEDHNKCKSVCCHIGNGTGYHHWYKCMCCKDKMSQEMQYKIMDTYHRKTTLVL